PDDRDFPEYYVLGTLASVAGAIITGLLARAALSALLACAAGSGCRSDRRQAVGGGSQRLELLREGEADLRPAELRPGEERRAGHGGQAGILDEPSGEGHVVLVGQVADVGHRVVGAGRTVDAEPGGLEGGQE